MPTLFCVCVFKSMDCIFGHCVRFLFQQMSEEAAGGVCVHCSALDIIVVLLLADASDLWINCFRMHKDQAADTCFWSHGIAFCQLDSQWPSVTMAVSMIVATSTCAVTFFVHHTSVQNFQYFSFHGLVRAAAISDCWLYNFRTGIYRLVEP